MLLDIQPLPLKTFHFDPDRQTLTAEASDFGGSFRLERLYDDAYDIGIAVQGLTKVERFRLNDEYRNADGDITHWEFLPVSRLNNVRLLTIFND